MWTYRVPAVVLGCSQRALQEAARRRLDNRAALLLRESGGGAVLTGPWLVSASVVLPTDHAWLRGGVVPSYRAIAELHLAALAAVGVAAFALPPPDVARANDAGASVRWACFGSLSPWELVGPRGRKLVGLAQRRRRSAVLLVAGTLVSECDWPLLCDAMDQAHHEPVLRQRTVSCSELIGRSIDAAQFASALEQRLARALATTA